MRNILLIGFTSTGKTAIGKLLADNLGCTFRDLDDLVEEIHRSDRGQSRRCREIFSLYGRDCFVEYEARALDGLKPDAGLVIATGGGTPIDPANRMRLTALGLVVYLKAIPEVIFDRMVAKGLPHFLKNDPTLENVRRHWFERDSIYEQCASCTIDTSFHSAEESARAIALKL